ncbi:uncharacterized protein [Choristoneura fumiferana]|uniref:uncharacterized protein n=1 Tax=Choristoneura fumiferana TaxID=7141 RepID=UPI003D15D9FD
MLRFRENKVAVTGDIKDMFLRVKIQPQDQNALRFLWRDNPTGPVKTYVMTSLIFGAKCSPFVAQFIKNKNALRYESSSPAAVDAVVNSHYMDDYIQSLPDEATAVQMVRDVTNIHKEGGFEIRNWTSNSLAVLNSIPEETLGTAAVRFKIDQQYEGERTLGLLWYPGTDELGFDVSLKRIPDCIIQHKQRPTKRIMLRVIMSIFDVFGFLSPFIIQGRIMLQDTWRLDIGWDNEIPNDIYKKWCEWIELLKIINKIRSLTVPRLELQAALLAARLADAIQKAHKLDVARRYFWCDSTTVLHWLNNSSRNYKAFEANRLGEIDDLTSVSEWRYVPTKLNVADIATREVFDYNLFLNDWFKGPQFYIRMNAIGQ